MKIPMHINCLSVLGFLKLLFFTMVATICLDHSQLDLFINKFFYVNDAWVIEKGAQPLNFIFYDLPKYMLILLATYLWIGFIIRSVKQRIMHYSINPKSAILPWTNLEILYILTVLIIVPLSIGALKSVTHVSCPNHLNIFGGNNPYLDIWHSIISKANNKCFPAAHASVGFVLFAFAFVPSLYQYRYRSIGLGFILGWVLGMYKMLIGDHFFSHTFASMLLSLTIAYGLAYVFFAPIKRIT